MNLPTGLAYCRWLAPATLGFMLGAALFSTPVRADEPGGFVIRTAYTELQNGVYNLNADIDLSLSDAAVNALENGLPLTVELQIQIIRHRRLMWDKTVAELAQRYQISYHALTRRFIITNLNSGDEQSFANYRDAVTSLGQISDLPVIDAKLLDPEASYKIRMRAVLDVKDFPGPLQLIASLFKSWDLTSAWYEWVLTS